MTNTAAATSAAHTRVDRCRPRDSRIWFAAPGSTHYETAAFTNHKGSFVNISVSGTSCSCRCEHCNGRLLETMIPAETPEKMNRVVDALVDRGCRGILVSGGADARGIVPLTEFMGSMQYARKRGLTVLAHPGLIEEATALRLMDCGVSQVLLDVIGDARTIKEVYHLDRTPRDYLESMISCKKAGLDFAPHLVAGLHFGRMLGEYAALRMIRDAGARTLVIVVLTPTAGTGMRDLDPPGLDEIKSVFEHARAMDREIFLTLGCKKPPGAYKIEVERMAVDCGFDGIAFPGGPTISYCIGIGRIPVFMENCCSMSWTIQSAPAIENSRETSGGRKCE